MPRYRDDLPQLKGGLFLTDGGLETCLMFHDGFELPEIAAFVLLDSDDGRERLRRYFRRYADIAREYNTGFILESMTWRASRDWGRKLGYYGKDLAEMNRKGIELLEEIREDYEGYIPHQVISGCMGSRGDGYRADIVMTADEAEAYHREQIATFRSTEADLVTAFTIPCSSEAIGIVRAAKAEEMQVVISFTTETGGRLPSGESLKEAIEKVDVATNGFAAYFMINCAHPTHFIDLLEDAPWSKRIRAVRANASKKSHAELDHATELDSGDIEELAGDYLRLADRLKNLNILGGCCGTDHRHIAEIGNRFNARGVTST